VADADGGFDPYAALGALERNRVNYIVIGGIARVLRGADEVTNDLDICPQNRPDNLRRLDQALRELGAEPHKSPDQRVTDYATNAGPLSVVLEPTGIDRGYDGLRRQADREPIGHGLRVLVADVADLVRNLEQLGRDLDTAHADQLRVMVELERSLGQSRGRDFGIDR
jgi:hypothetical protein